MNYHDRQEAGELLSDVLAARVYPHPVVVAVARGGVMVGAPVAQRLGAPLDVIFARKIAHPFSPEFSIGAVTESGEAVWGGDSDVAGGRWRQERADWLRRVARQLRERHLGSRRPLPLAGRTAIIVDDGIATGLTMLAAIQTLRDRQAEAVVVAAPVSSRQAAERLAGEVDELVVLCEPVRGFTSVSEFYQDFTPVDDEAVGRALRLFRDHPDRAELIDRPDLDTVLESVKRYPASSSTIARKARALRAPSSVVGFFESIPGGTLFSDKDDVLRRSRQVEMILEEEQAEQRAEPEDEHTYPGD